MLRQLLTPAAATSQHGALTASLSAPLLFARARTFLQRCSLPLGLPVLSTPALLLSHRGEARRGPDATLVTPPSLSAAVAGGFLAQTLLRFHADATATASAPWDAPLLMSGLGKWTGKSKRKLNKANHGARPANHVGRHARRVKGTRYRNYKGKGY